MIGDSPTEHERNIAHLVILTLCCKWFDVLYAPGTWRN